MWLKSLIIHIVLLCCSLTSLAQINNREVQFAKYKDSLNTELALHPANDNQRIRLLKAAVHNPYLFYLRQRIELEPLCLELQALAKQLHDYEAIALSYEYIARRYKSAREYDIALAYLDTALAFCPYVPATAQATRKASALYAKALILRIQEKYAEALDANFQLLAIQPDPAYIPSIKQEIGDIYILFKNYDKAIEYLEDAQAITPNNFLTFFSGHTSLAQAYVGNNQIDEALKVLNSQLPFVDSINYITLSSYYYVFATANAAENNFSQAINQLETALSMQADYRHEEFEINLLLKLSEYNLALNQMKQASYYLDSAKQVVIEVGKIEFEAQALLIESRIYEKQGNFIEAYKSLTKSLALKDKVFNEETAQYNTNLSAIFQTERIKQQAREAELVLYKRQDSLTLLQAISRNDIARKQYLIASQEKDLSLKNKQLTINNQELNANRQSIDLLQKDKELQHLEYLRSQAILQAQKLEGDNKQKALEYLSKDQVLKTTKLKALTQENDLNKLRRRQTLLISSIVASALLLGGVFLFGLYRNKQTKMKLDILQKEQAFKEGMAEASMRALRSQMNPHFIFNSLNSINSVVVEGNVPLASDYLTKFSKLIRLILDNSTQSLIPLAKEVEALKLYLLMESIRFKNKFTYNVAVSEALDEDSITIAPTTLQPFVENAILHGIMHLSTPGIIDIKIQALQKNCLQITIDDNGVGRTKAAELKSRTNINKSHGYQITADRIKQINSNNSITVYDKADDQLQAAGTTVIIKWFY
jgi:tetratricopeptide (TPR) repeat protein